MIAAVVIGAAAMGAFAAASVLADDYPRATFQLLVSFAFLWLAEKNRSARS